MMKLRIVVVFFVVLLSISALGCCGAPIRDGDPGTIGACLSQPDGATVTLPAEQVIWRGKSGKSFAIKECFEPTPKTPRLVVISTRSLPVDNSMTVDVTGTLSTVSGTSKDGEPVRQRVIITTPENISVYCSPNGRPIVYPPVKGLGMEWSNKRTLIQLSGTSLSGISLSSMSLMDGGGFPVLDDSPNSESTPPAPGSRDSLKWLPDGTRVHLRNRLTMSAYSSKTSIEEPDRTNPIRVISDNYSVVSGNLVDITGTLATLDGERIVQSDTGATTIVDSGCAMPRPVGMNNKAIGGGSVGQFTPAIGSSSGTNNTGMLATVWGKATIVGPMDKYSNFYSCIDDGSGLDSGDGNTGIRVYLFDWPAENDYVSVTGIVSSLITDSSTSVPVLYQVNDITYPTYSTGSGTISGTITAGISAANATAWVHSTGGSTKCTLNAAGVGTYSLAVKPGDHTVSVDVAGYAHAAAKATVTANQVTTRNFTLTSIGKGIYVYTNNSRIAPDGVSTTTVTAIVYDEEGRRLPNQPVSWSIDVGSIVTSDSLTNNVGEATATVRSSTNHETGTVWAESGSVGGGCYVEYANEEDPSVIILKPTYNTTVSGTLQLDVSVVNMREDGTDTISKQVLLVDGQECGTFCSANYTQTEESAKIPGFNTAWLVNGSHAICAKVIDENGTEVRSNIVPIVVYNPISELRMNCQDLLYDDPNQTGFTFDFNANQSPWAVRIFSIEEDDTETTVWSTSGNQTGPVHLAWDGKVNGQYQSDIYMVSFDTGVSQSSMTMAQRVTTELSARQNGGTSTSTNEYAIISVNSRTGADEILIAAVTSLFDWIDEHETYSEMRAVGNNAKKRGVIPVYVCDMNWKSSRDHVGLFTGEVYGMDYWLDTGMENIHHFYLNTHGQNVRVFGGTFQNSVQFADEGRVYGTDSWAPHPETVPAFTDLHLIAGKLKVVHFSVCDSMGSPEHPNNSIARALGCRDDLSGCTFVGWQGDYKPFGWYNGLGWVRGFWHYLCKDYGVSVYQANQQLNSTSNPIYWNTIHSNLRMYTDLESTVTYLE